VEERFSTPVQTGPMAHTVSCATGTGSFPGVENGSGVTLPPSPLSSAVVKKQSRTILLLSLRAFVTCKRVKPTYIGLHVKYVYSLFLSRLMKLEFSRKIFEKHSNEIS
jgi:hypothetical protein